MEYKRRIARLEGLMPEPEIETEQITVDAGDGYKLDVSVSLLPIIERIYGNEQH
jgi:hypothetical protein